MKKALWLAVLLPFLFLGTAQATFCNGVPFCNGGEQGPPGPQGEQGERGPRGYTGKHGKHGTDGVDGRDAVVDYDDEYEAVEDLARALSAAQVHLPQNKDNRITFGLETDGGGSAAGIGFAHMLEGEERTAITIQLGASGSERVLKGSIGFEF